MAPVTVYDVAKKAGVGIATVSRVFRRSQEVSMETRQRVLQAAQELGYVPDAAAQALASRRSNIIGLILTRAPHHISSDAFLNQILFHLISEFRKLGMHLLLEIVEDVQNPEGYLHLVKSNRIDGLIFSGPRSDDEALVALIERGFPTVLMGYLPNTNCFSVDINNRAAARTAVEHLIHLGHKRIACITNASLSYSAAAERLSGYQEALEAAHIPYDEALVRYGDFNLESGYIQMNNLLDEAFHFTAVFIASDVVAFGAMSAARERGLHIPKDLAVVGFDDVPLAQYVDPTLTTMRLPTTELAICSSDLIIQLICGEVPEQRHVFLPTELVVRDSCGVV
ncbi:MAG: LacI family DNA-binding transcriptional regulator [Chloroflexota bacterium]